MLRLVHTLYSDNVAFSNLQQRKLIYIYLLSVERRLLHESVKYIKFLL